MSEDRKGGRMGFAPAVEVTQEEGGSLVIASSDPVKLLNQIREAKGADDLTLHSILGARLERAVATAQDKGVGSLEGTTAILSEEIEIKTSS